MIGKGGWRQICLGSAALLVLTLSACKVERPDTVLSDGQMEDILYDYHIARAMGEEIPHNDSYKRVLYVDAVFRKHGVVLAQSHRYCGDLRACKQAVENSARPLQ